MEYLVAVTCFWTPFPHSGCPLMTLDILFYGVVHFHFVVYEIDFLLRKLYQHVFGAGQYSIPSPQKAMFQMHVPIASTSHNLYGNTVTGSWVTSVTGYR